MTITNILKDGTVVEDMSKVTVPKEVVEKVLMILQRSEKGKKDEIKDY